MSEPEQTISPKSVLSTRGTFRELIETITPEVVTRLSDEIEEKLSRIPTRLNVYKYDAWGFHPDSARQLFLVTSVLYRYWFRVENHGIENLPAGRCLVIGNHAGQIALDAGMICVAALLEAEPPRILRGMGEFFLPNVPFLNILMHRLGSVVGTPKNCIDLLEHDEAVIAFPEGVRGISKLFWERYQLKEFGLGFMRLALATGAPIIPVAVVGSEEQTIAIANLETLGRRLGLPSLPITLTFPWLGLLGLVPLPVKYRIYWGKPMRFEGNPNDEDSAIRAKVADVQATIQKMVNVGLAERESWFT
ncbi:MAG: lysophospholipid acyltransferase family protein [Candidatus Binatia bacterium]